MVAPKTQNFSTPAARGGERAEIPVLHTTQGPPKNTRKIFCLPQCIAAPKTLAKQPVTDWHTDTFDHFFLFLNIPGDFRLQLCIGQRGADAYKIQGIQRKKISFTDG